MVKGEKPGLCDEELHLCTSCMQWKEMYKKQLFEIYPKLQIRYFHGEKGERYVVKVTKNEITLNREIDLQGNGNIAGGWVQSASLSPGFEKNDEWPRSTAVVDAIFLVSIFFIMFLCIYVIVKE